MAGVQDNPRFGLQGWSFEWDGVQEVYTFGDQAPWLPFGSRCLGVPIPQSAQGGNLKIGDRCARISSVEEYEGRDRWIA